MNSLRIVIAAILLTLFSGCGQYVSKTAALKRVDLSEAVIVVRASELRQTKAAEILLEEIEKRTGVQLATSNSMPADSVATIVLGTVESLDAFLKLPKKLQVPGKAEGYTIWVETKGRKAPRVYLVGCDDRGVLFAAGRLIRLARMSQGKVSISADVRLASAPRYPIRGHMLIPGGNFIEWDEAGYEQYIRDLVIFGTNSFELTDYHGFVAEILDSYGLDLWVFFGHGDVVDMRSLRDVEDRFGDLKGLDHVFIPLGDSSGTEIPTVMIPAADRFAPLLKKVHPNAKIWLSYQCQRDHAEHDNEYIFGYLDSKQPDWLEGMVYGPWSRGGISDLRLWTPAQYKIRHYPDICHNRRCQYAIPKWDRAFARVWGRNGIRAMPRMMTQVHNATAPLTDGFVAYNHTGCNNDLAKFVFSAMAWDPDSDTNEVLREYGKVFFGDELADDVAKGLSMLEDNWTGAIAENKGIEKALEQWKRIARRSGAQSNWRVGLYLYKAFIDAYVKRKYDAEMRYEAEAYDALKRAKDEGVEKAVQAARAVLAKVDKEFPPREELKRELSSWGLDKYEDKELSKALENLYYALNDRQWLEAEFEKIPAMEDEAAQLARIDRIIKWEDAGPGGFYDNLGVEGRQPHLVRQVLWEDDPGYVYSPIEHHRHEPGSTHRQSWLVSALTRYDTPLLMRYEGLDTKAKYRVRVVYSGPYGPVTRLLADGQYEIHGALEQPKAMRPLEFDIPENATADGNLNLEWQLVNLRRGLGVGEVWLIKQEN